MAIDPPPGFTKEIKYSPYSTPLADVKNDASHPPPGFDTKVSLRTDKMRPSRNIDDRRNYVPPPMANNPDPLAASPQDYKGDIMRRPLEPLDTTQQSK